MEQGCLFAPRFLEKFVGKSILYDPKTAIMELIANAWDAGATRVDVFWPDSDGGRTFSIADNGTGMKEQEINYRWRTLSYDRQAEQGDYAEFPPDVTLQKRRAFGRNGVGRFAGFCFGEAYFVETVKSGKSIRYKVSHGSGEAPFKLEKVSECSDDGHGTRIFVENLSRIRLPAEEARAEIGMRFLTDPGFAVYVDGVRVALHHIPERHISESVVEVEGVGTIKITIIDTLETDRTTKQHGIAWHVNGRLVGDCSWKGLGFDELIDGRRIEAKRYSFIVEANCLVEAVKQDWSGFDEAHPAFEKAIEALYREVKSFVLEMSKEKRKETLDTVKKTYKAQLAQMPNFKREKWEQFVEAVQEECPAITERDLTKLSGVLASLELSESKYKLIGQLHELKPSQLDDLHNILQNWTVDIAKEVLDELKIRIKLLDELKIRVLDEKADEVHELQPLFHQGLWIFGPEYETIEFTSNEGMTNVIRKLFGAEITGSRNRPDFVILPDGSVGAYYYPTYDDYAGESGVARLVIVELKKPGIPIGDKEKSQCWKYVSELYRKGLIQDSSRVTCFVLGDSVDPFEGRERKEFDGRVVIQPMDYNIVIERAKSRLLKLYDRVKGAPFLQGKVEIKEFVEEREPQLSIAL